MERGIVSQAQVPFHAVASAPLLGASPLGLARGLLALAQGITQAYRLLDRLGASAVLATGGYVSVPVVLAARLRAIPSLVYLPDIVPGLAVTVLARVANRVATTHPSSRGHLPSEKVVVTGYPVRPEVGAWSKKAARERLGLPIDGLVLLIWGGSRGARSINQAVLRDLETLTERATILHITGEDGVGEALARRATLGPAALGRYHVYEYLYEEFAAALAAADLTVSRAGASVLGEYPAAGLPSILVPYPGLVRQRENAQALVEAGGAVVVADDALEELLPVLHDLLARPGQLARMTENVRSLAPAAPAAEEIARLLIGLATREAASERTLSASREG
jgi:UDP-N-acetylglucosamine--N-acetylmuramyl-(pentapeptide) pyrophosphoryl-undecaprenol N-acetylglucosamine transferase